jgi:hypothetical protein
MILNQSYVPKKGHTEVVDKGYEATKTQDGLTDGSHCGICGEVIKEQNVIYAIGSQGLEYSVLSGNTCKITGRGTCTDTELVIPAYIDSYEVTSIGYYAFGGCSSLTSITIPEGVTSIGNSAFYGCSRLTSITIPEGVTSIGDDAFAYCRSLTSITIPEGVTSIGDYAFDGCSSLMSITIPESVTSIGNYAFSGCIGLTSINYIGTIAEWNAIEKGYDWNAFTPNYTVYCTDGTITK